MCLVTGLLARGYSDLYCNMLGCTALTGYTSIKPDSYTPGFLKFPLSVESLCMYMSITNSHSWDLFTNFEQML